MAAMDAGTRTPDGTVRGLPLVLLRSEGAALLGLAIVLYAKFGRSWILFAVLLLAPDLGALGYVRDTRIGAMTYDLVHTYLPPAILGAIGVLADNSLMWSVAIIWFGHIGMDRLVGFGLKYPDSFKHTHLGWMGRGDHAA
ncbi:MAG TPA: DUF4260 domain-containing protein [Actinomycetota bacterium]|nr:DUF4260 domain-containing protein [Actinomycetota bacterium]